MILARTGTIGNHSCSLSTMKFLRHQRVSNPPSNCWLRDTGTLGSVPERLQLQKCGAVCSGDEGSADKVPGGGSG